MHIASTAWTCLTTTTCRPFSNATAWPLCRLLLAGKVVTLACDLGIAALTILNLCSMANNPATTGTSYASSKAFRAELLTAVLSCTFTILSFGVSIFGFQRVLTSLQAAVRRVSNRVSQHLSIRSTRTAEHTATNGVAGYQRIAPAPQVRCPPVLDRSP